MNKQYFLFKCGYGVMEFTDGSKYEGQYSKDMKVRKKFHN